MSNEKQQASKTPKKGVEDFAWKFLDFYQQTPTVLKVNLRIMQIVIRRIKKVLSSKFQVSNIFKMKWEQK